MLETRALLIETGLREFARHGFDVPSIRGICARAGLTRGAFYTHFSDRDAFFVAVMERALHQMMEDLPRRGVLREDVGEMFEVVERILVELSRRVDSRDSGEESGALRFHMLLAASDRSATVRARFRVGLDETRERLAGILANAQRSGRVRRDLSCQDLAGHIVTQALGILASASAGIPIDASHVLRTMRGFLLDE